MSKTIGVSLFALMIASSANAQQIGDIFYIALENHNFTQPSSVTSPEQLLGNPAAPFLNTLVKPGNPNAAMVSYASNYQNVSPTLHPSEPNYVWQVSGTHGPLNDDDPYPNNIVNAPSLRPASGGEGHFLAVVSGRHRSPEHVGPELQFGGGHADEQCRVAEPV